MEETQFLCEIAGVTKNITPVWKLIVVNLNTDTKCVEIRLQSIENWAASWNFDEETGVL